MRTKPAPQNHSATPSSPLSDQQIVEACLAGDERAWEMLIKKYKRLIYSFPRRYGARADDAEEVFQLVCVELFLSLAGLRDQQSLRAWITAVAKHQAYHWKRRHIKRSAREGEELNPSIAASTPSASGSVEAQDRARVLRDAIGRLPPRDRALVRLLFFVDPPASYETIALRLGIAAGSVSSTRTRCLQKLARSMGGGHKR